MEEISNTELIKALQTQLSSLQKRIHELETENAKLSVQLSSCVCQKIVESDKTRVLDCSRPIERMKMLNFDENDAKSRSKEKVPDIRRDKMALHHLPKRHIALKVMYFGQRFYGFASEAQMDPTIEALQKTRLISSDKKDLQYSRCGRTDKGVSSAGQETAGSNGHSGESMAEESCGGEIDYVKILNRVLPQDIRIIGWSPAPTDFRARCLILLYFFLFPQVLEAKHYMAVLSSNKRKRTHVSVFKRKATLK
ncbi:tRNA pseudouridine(38/39) synthase [Handroanthus impetiginosus]|uniref:tRNA pseudouridine(38/39) synthase n=1 Tax=Handroanthus impetiginosus TaxID=429701 RepID=A0A2G9HST3_9LAMI|nr:tRNA pseudouridine(38/39) synthase [Handroanthus impetiginosus]